MEKYQMPAEIERLQKKADALLDAMTSESLEETMHEHNRLLLRISNMKKWIKPPSTADYQMSWGVTYIGKTVL